MQSQYRKKRAAPKKNPSKLAVYKAPQTQVVRAPRQPRAPPAKAHPGKGLLSTGGSILGGMLGGGPGAAIGGKIGDIVSNLVGFGDYAIEGNTLMGIDPPELRNTPAGMIIRHREFISDIAPSVNFVNQSFPINPGLSSTFPWLSQIAVSFEEYRLRGMVFEFKSMSSDSILSSGSSTALGTVCMATQYNSLNSNFLTKKEMENYQFANSSKPSQSFLHPVECKHSLTAIDQLFVRTSPNTTNLQGDLRLYDAGEFQIATVGMQNTTGVVGELWVTYEVEFLKPRFQQFALEDHYMLSSASNASPFGTNTGNHTVNGASNGFFQRNTIGGAINGSGSAYSFPVSISSGKFMIVYSVQGSANPITAPTVTYTNCVSVAAFTDQTNTRVYATGNPTFWSYTEVIQITGSGASFAWASTILPLSVTSGDLYVIGLSNTVI